MGRHHGGIADCAEILKASMIFHKKTLGLERLRPSSEQGRSILLQFFFSGSKMQVAVRPA
jgi:hypothetical protein